jgi:hypothetical protein
MLAEAAQEVRILLNRLDGEIDNLPYMAGARDKSDSLAKRDSPPVTTVPNRGREGVAVCGVQTKHDLDQRRWGSSGWYAKVRVAK